MQLLAETFLGPNPTESFVLYDLKYARLQVSSPEPPTSRRGAAYGAVVLELGGSKLTRAANILTLRLRVRLAVRAMTRSGIDEPRVFAFAPALESATFVYELASSAAAYSAGHFRLDDTERWPSLKRLLVLIAGCDVSVGTIVVVGTIGR